MSLKPQPCVVQYRLECAKSRIAWPAVARRKPLLHPLSTNQHASRTSNYSIIPPLTGLRFGVIDCHVQVS